MIRIILTLAMLAAFVLPGKAQPPSYNVKGKNFYQMKQEFDQYFETQARIHGWSRLQE